MSAGSADTAALAARLDELQAGLEAMLSCFESQRFPEQAAMEAAWSRIQRSFEGLSAQLAADPGRERASLQERVDHCLRLYAVAAGVLLQRRGELAAERAACSNARQRLGHLRPEGPRGGSCDVRA